MDLQSLFQSIDTSRPHFPCRPHPGKIFGSKGQIVSAATAGTQLRIRRSPELEWEVFSPVLYQNCMKPAEITLYPLILQVTPSGELRLDNFFRQTAVNPNTAEIEASPWKAEFDRADCSRCTNCGKCSW